MISDLIEKDLQFSPTTNTNRNDLEFIIVSDSYLVCVCVCVGVALLRWQCVFFSTEFIGNH